ncbi:MAG: hypothetical protein M1303_08275 [Bacteroidetes bacterium]|nr:hypothetical protein [Bacteroidota bacterium]
MHGLLQLGMLTAVVTQLSCNGNQIGPCVHIYKEPILHIESVQNSKTGAGILTITLTNIMIDTLEANLLSLIAESKGVAVLDSCLVCNPPCSFGTQGGDYYFKVTATGYRDTVITCHPSYSIVHGGCPSSSDGGLRINIAMEPI